jgi:hypothetical protein
LIHPYVLIRCTQLKSKLHEHSALFHVGLVSKVLDGALDRAELAFISKPNVAGRYHPILFGAFDGGSGGWKSAAYTLPTAPRSGNSSLDREAGDDTSPADRDSGRRHCPTADRAAGDDCAGRPRSGRRPRSPPTALRATTRCWPTATAGDDNANWRCHSAMDPAAPQRLSAYRRGMTIESRRHQALVELVSKRVSLSRHGDRLFGLCPLHAERTASFAIALERPFYYCSGCRASGDAVDFLVHVEHLDRAEAERIVTSMLER